MSPEVVCSGYLRDGGVVLHAAGCPVLIRAGDPTRRSHGLTAPCERAYRQVNGLRVEGRAPTVAPPGQEGGDAVLAADAPPSARRPQLVALTGAARQVVREGCEPLPEARP